ncbi:hypothetical protein [Spongiactinospora sp. 9N601]|uniref:hypothetical protein n=1 Tax=Spongiactinospora sp. 9N601 TaxID=3375149 RepID=UPI0037A5BEF0
MTVALIRFKLAAYTRSHRLLQPLFVLVLMLMIFYAVRAPADDAAGSYANSAGLLIVVFAWAARGLLDTEPDAQRVVSMAAAGGPRREIAAGLGACAAVNAGLAALAMIVPLLIGFQGVPPAAMIAQGVLLHLLAVATGIALGALTSRPIMPSPAASMLALFGGFAGLLLVSYTPVGAVLIPIMRWMRAANDGTLGADLPLLALPTLLWSAAGLVAYALLRRTRP